jgi:hypothetical protein
MCFIKEHRMVTGKIMFVLRAGVVLSVVALLTGRLGAQRPGAAATPDLPEQRS